MLNSIHNRLTSLATWPVVSLLLVGFLACQSGFDWRHRALGHAETPESLKWYTPGEICKLFEEWGDDRLALYAWTEVTLDLAFPLIYGTLFAVLIARLFQVGQWRWAVMVPLCGAAVDLMENATTAALAWSYIYNKQESPVAWAAACFTVVKIVCFVVSGLLLLGGGVAGLWRSRAETGG